MRWPLTEYSLLILLMKYEFQNKPATNARLFSKSLELRQKTLFQMAFEYFTLVFIFVITTLMISRQTFDLENANVMIQIKHISG
jgi:hypothetical protein